MTVEIRLADHDDDQALAAIDRAVWSPRSSPGPRPADDRPFFDARTAPGDVLVGLVDGRVAGYATLAPATPLPSGAHVLTLNGVAVEQQARRAGVGRALVAAAAAEARARGARRLTLRVLADNEPARRLYESLGFVVEGEQRQEFLLDGRYVDDVLMALDLTTAVS